VPFGNADKAAFTPSVFRLLWSFSLSSGVFAVLNLLAHSADSLLASSRVCSVAFSVSNARPSATVDARHLASALPEAEAATTYIPRMMRSHPNPRLVLLDIPPQNHRNAGRIVQYQGPSSRSVRKCQVPRALSYPDPSRRTAAPRLRWEPCRHAPQKGVLKHSVGLSKSLPCGRPFGQYNFAWGSYVEAA